MKCMVEGCSKPSKRKNLCIAHYTKLRRYGTPTPNNGYLPQGLERIEYFKTKVNYNGPIPENAPHLGHCHLWTASLSPKGYGQFLNERNQTAHVWLWTETNGPYEWPLVLDHLCRVRHCVNLIHLELVTVGENSLRGETFAAFNAAKTHCLNGHPLVSENSYGYKGRRQCKTCARARARGQDPKTVMFTPQ